MNIKSKMTPTDAAKFKAIEDAAVFSIKSPSQQSILSNVASSSFENFEFKEELLEIIGGNYFNQFALGDI